MISVMPLPKQTKEVRIMKNEYKRAELVITPFDEEDVITTSGINPEDKIHVDYGSEPPVPIGL